MRINRIRVISHTEYFPGHSGAPPTLIGKDVTSSSRGSSISLQLLLEQEADDHSFKLLLHRLVSPSEPQIRLFQNLFYGEEKTKLLGSSDIKQALYKV